MHKVKPGGAPPFVCTLNHGTAAGIVDGSLFELQGALGSLGWLRVTKASTFEADAELVERDTSDVVAGGEDAVSALKLARTLPGTIKAGLKAKCVFGGVALPWRATAAAGGGTPAALWRALGDLESRKLKSQPSLRQAQDGVAPTPDEVAVSYDAGHFEVRGRYSSVSGCAGGDGEFLIARVDEVRRRCDGSAPRTIDLARRRVERRFHPEPARPCCVVVAADRRGGHGD